MTDKQEFNTDVARLLDIVANALYSNQDIFLRELISNASDACDRLRYAALQEPELTAKNPNFEIRILVNPDNRTLTIQDNGIGMNKQDLTDNLGTIARSGTAAIMDQLADSKDNLNLIGQFGVGFYASFMIAATVDVISRKAGDNQTWLWSSDGRTGFTTREADNEETTKLPDERGTHITLHLKDDIFEYLIEDKLKEIITTYSDHIDVPVYIGSKKDDENPVNAASALWTRPKKDISEEQYKEFYHHLSHGFDDPILTSHWKAEGVIEYSALLFIPTMRPWDLYDPNRKHCVKLYVKRVYITDQLDSLLYPWMRFVRGIIDSEDLPLNISREMLQNNPVIQKIRSGVTKRILSDLNKLSQDDTPAFESFWLQFGPVLKEGLYDAVEHREDIFKICRFHSSSNPEKLISLQNYIDDMQDGQDEIYYLSGENIETLKNSPQLEGFKARNLNVLFFTDTVDDFWLQMAGDYQEKKFISITKGSINLKQFDKDDKKDSENKDKEEKDNNKDSADLHILVEALAAQLKDQVSKINISDRLTDSPVCLVADASSVDMNMERVLKIHQNYQAENKRVLEINGEHSLIQKLAHIAKNDKESPILQQSAQLLYEQALIIQGEPVQDPTGFARRMADFMEKGLAA